MRVHVNAPILPIALIATILTFTQVSAGVAATATLIPAILSWPFDVAVDGAENVYIADTLGGAVRRWDAATHETNASVNGPE